MEQLEVVSLITGKKYTLEIKTNEIADYIRLLSFEQGHLIDRYRGAISKCTGICVDPEFDDAHLNACGRLK